MAVHALCHLHLPLLRSPVLNKLFPPILVRSASTGRRSENGYMLSRPISYQLSFTHPQNLTSFTFEDYVYGYFETSELDSSTFNSQVRARNSS